MKIKIVMLSRDSEYTKRLSRALYERYSDRIELALFTNAAKAIDAAKDTRPDLFLIGEEFLEESLPLPRGVEVACLSEQGAVESIAGYIAIAKYQRVSLIYQALLDLYARRSQKIAISMKRTGEQEQRILTFLSPAGGTGASTVAAAGARHLATSGERVLYLNLEVLGTADRYFSGEGSTDFSRVIYTLAMAGSGTAARLESTLRQDDCGVYFIAGADVALDMLSLDQDAMELLFEALGKISLFNWIVVDMDCVFDERLYAQIERSFATVLVSDGTPHSNEKLDRALDVLRIVGEQRKDFPDERIYILYNRFSSQNGQKSVHPQFKELGGIGRIQNATTAELVQLISKNEVFDAIVQ